MDPITASQALRDLPPQVVDLGCDFLRAIGQPFSHLVGAITDEIRGRRWARLFRVMNRTRQIADENGIKIREGCIDEGFLFPFMDRARDATDETLAEAWARLLASAIADPMNQHPAFVQRLGELVRDELVILSVLAQYQGDGVRTLSCYDGEQVVSAVRQSVPDSLITTGSRADERFDAIPGLHNPRYIGAYRDHMDALGLVVLSVDGGHGCLNDLGRAFVAACGVDGEAAGKGVARP